jgi:sirohydrochlorin cobaltochelatase
MDIISSPIYTDVVRSTDMKKAVLLIGHGSPAADTPREMVRELKQLEEERQRARLPAMTPREKEVDAKVRYWPRTPKTDPYKQGLETIQASLAKRMPGCDVAVAYNEFCAPSIDEAVERLVQEGHDRIVFVTTMFTRGGVHAECEIPWEMKGAQGRHPTVRFSYAWPFDADGVADLLARQAEAAP